MHFKKTQSVHVHRHLNVCMPAPVCAYCKTVARQTETERERNKAKVMLSIVGWTELFEISFPRAKSDQCLRCGHRAAKWWGRSGSGGEERRKSLRRRLRWRRIWMGKFHLLVCCLSWAIMAENKEKSCNNQLLHQIQTSLVWKMKRWNDWGAPPAILFLFYPFISLTHLPRYSLISRCWPDVRSATTCLCRLSLNTRLKTLRRNQKLLKDVWYNWASMFIFMFIHSAALHSLRPAL